MSGGGLTYLLVLPAAQARFQITASPFHQGKHANSTTRNQRSAVSSLLLRL